MTTCVEFVIAGDADRWRAAGFTVNDHGVLQLGGIRLRLIDPAADAGSSGIRAWVLADAPDTRNDLIDDLPTSYGEAPDPTGLVTTHPNGVLGIDHVVVYTPDLERTCAAIEAVTAAPLKRIREVGALRQGFHRLGELIVEVVTFPEVSVERATFWGLALNVVDIDSMFDTYGDQVLSPPKNAVQPGRRIASFRDSAGLGLPVAVMTNTTR